MYKCPLCGNTEKRYLGNINGRIYCRRCISFKGELVEEKAFIEEKVNSFQGININYSLSVDQTKISQAILKGFIEGKDTLVYAVCGAGKTELVFKVIEYALINNLKIGFAIPRKDVVIELKERLAHTFNKNKVIAIYGGNRDDLKGDILVLTTHQLFRFEHYFDLLILDEIDAFPYRGNPVLIALFKRSLKGHYVLMSATPSDEVMKEFEKDNKQILTLFKRYHEHPLIVPSLKIRYLIFKYSLIIDYLKKYEREKKKVFIFCPTIKETEYLFKILNLFIKNGNYVHSKRLNRANIIDDFRNDKYSYLVTTSVLERGVTVKNLQVIIYHADHELYSKEALIQISGRVGRSSDYPSGEVIYVASKKTTAILESIKTIEGFNKCL